MELIRAVAPAVYFTADLALYSWLSLEAVRIMHEHGPTRSLIGSARITVSASAEVHGPDRELRYRAMHRLLALGEARGYKPETSVLRAQYASVVVCWTEPVENALRAVQQARAELIAGGDLAYAAYAYQTAVSGLLECAATLDVYAHEVEAALAFSRRTGNETTAQWFDSYRWLAAALRGEGPGGTVVADVPAGPVQYADNPAAQFLEHLAQALVAAVLGDTACLVHHATAAMPLLPAASGFYPTAVARLLRGLACAEQAHEAVGAERAALLTELDELSGWLADRAAHAPDNFLHLVRWLEAERAWASGNFRAAATAFDAARREVARRQRPWHRALMTERAARFFLAHGLDHVGSDLLAEARHLYDAWGATAKVAQLDWASPGLLTGARAGAARDRAATDPPEMTTGTIDLFGVLSASHALSSETTVERLHDRVTQVLSAMTGATGVHLLLWDDNRREWLSPGRVHGHEPSGDRVLPHHVPMSVLRYVQRTGDSVIVDDVTRDDRFARDPYLARLDSCSLLATPVVSRGAMRAVLLLENCLFRAAFTAQRLEAVRLIAAQLAVSLDNAQLYTDLLASRARIVAAADQARRRIERDLHDGAQQRLITLALHAHMARAAAPPGEEALRQELEALITEATTAMDELRELARGIHPAALVEGGLNPALRALARRSPVPVQVEVSAIGRMPVPIETAAYYVVAEALTNAAKHAQASAVTVTVETDDTPAGPVLRVQVQDDGRGAVQLAGGSGLLGLADRVETLGGRLAVRSEPGSGTTVQAEVPLDPNGLVPA
jgi:signal transduction histidine kinase